MQSITILLISVFWPQDLVCAGESISGIIYTPLIDAYSINVVTSSLEYIEF